MKSQRFFDPSHFLCIAPLLGILIILSLIPPVNAQETAQSTYSGRYQRCVANDSSNISETRCTEEEVARRKPILAVEYTSAMRDASSENRILLEKSQRLWLQFREANCQAKMVKGGSAATLSYLTCILDMTIARTAELKDFGVW